MKKIFVLVLFIRNKMIATLDKWLSPPRHEPIDFASQLGTPIDKFPEESEIVRRIAVGLSRCAVGDFERGGALLLENGVLGHDRAFIPSGKHAYVYTELLSLGMQAIDQMRTARGHGLFPLQAQLAWIRKHDLILGDLLVHLKRPVQPLSCAGAFSHYMTEVHLGYPIVEPMIQSAEIAYKQQYAESI